MSIEFASIANNASVLITEYSKYGTLIDVCNKFKQKTGKNIDEYVVMLLTSQILLLIDHLHSCKIIHADIKPDNFLVMEPVQYGKKEPCLQIIDFGISIDMELMPKGITFKMVSLRLEILLKISQKILNFSEYFRLMKKIPALRCEKTAHGPTKLICMA